MLLKKRKEEKKFKKIYLVLSIKIILSCSFSHVLIKEMQPLTIWEGDMIKYKFIKIVIITKTGKSLLNFTY